MESLVRQSFATIRSLLDTRELRAVELTRLYLERISSYDALGAYVTVDPEGALAAAELADRELDAGINRGLLHGIPIGVKDNIAVAGLPMRSGSWTFEDFVPVGDAAVVAAARAAGAVILGKLSMHEVGLGDPVRDGLLRTGVHPWHEDYLPGGSSSGSAVAAAAGLCVLALGTDTGGSVRNPAASCGVIGFKPTYGRVDARGVLPLCWSLDTVGFLARDLDAVEAGLVGLGSGAPAGELPRPPRLRYLSDEALGEMAPEVFAAYSETLEAWRAAGADLDAAPPLSFEAAGSVWQARLAETYQVHFTHLLADPTRYSSSMRGIFEQGAGVDAATYAASWEDQARLIAEFEDALAGYDALVLPANPRPALRWGEWEGLNVFQWYRFTWPFNVTGQPAVTVPCALSPEGLPIAYQLVGRRGEDEHLIRVARWAIRERRFEAQAPPLSGPNSDLP